MRRSYAPVSKYEVGANFSYRAEFNRGALATRIRELSSKSGFFKTSSLGSLLDQSSSNSWFKFVSNCDDSRVCEEGKREKIIEIKKRLLQQVLDDISLSKIGANFDFQNAPQVPDTGASKAANGIRNNCLHAYCQAAAVVIDVLAASNGGSSKVDNYIKSNDHVVVEKVSETTPVLYSGVMGFSK